MEILLVLGLFRGQGELAGLHARRLLLEMRRRPLNSSGPEASRHGTCQPNVIQEH
jgi:hypothetical protein